MTNQPDYLRIIEIARVPAPHWYEARFFFDNAPPKRMAGPTMAIRGRQMARRAGFVLKTGYRNATYARSVADEGDRTTDFYALAVGEADSLPVNADGAD